MLAPTFRPSSYRTAHCRRWGSCPPVSRHWANVLMLRRRNALVNLLPSLMRTSRALSLVAAPHRAIKIILALALNLLPCHHPHGRYRFAVSEEINRMKTWLLERYASSTFNTCPHRPLHCMAGPPIEIHVSPSAKPRAFHTPASIPLHWQQQVHADLLRDEALGILEKVPHGEPTQRCHRIVITRKHDGTPRRTVDLSPLNKFCRRETFASETLFKLVRRIHSNTWKSVTDAWNGYHSVPLHESDRHLTTLHYLDAGDIQGHHKVFFLREMATIVASPLFCLILCERRCVDDTVFFDENLEEHWWRTIQFLTLVGCSGIVLNPRKF